jgi:hypothetical protein
MRGDRSDSAGLHLIQTRIPKEDVGALDGIAVAVGMSRYRLTRLVLRAYLDDYVAGKVKPSRESVR